MKIQLITLITLCVLFVSCQQNNGSVNEALTSHPDTLEADTAVTETKAYNQNEISESSIPQVQPTPQQETQETSSNGIDLEETYVRPGIMTSSDGRGGSNSTYFRFQGNQLEKINEKDNFHESYTIIDKKSIGNDIYFTIKGRATNIICQIIIKSEENGANILLFIVPGEFDERYIAF